MVSAQKAARISQRMIPSTPHVSPNSCFPNLAPLPRLVSSSSRLDLKVSVHSRTPLHPLSRLLASMIRSSNEDSMTLGWSGHSLGVKATKYAKYLDKLVATRKFLAVSEECRLLLTWVSHKNVCTCVRLTSMRFVSHIN